MLYQLSYSRINFCGGRRIRTSEVVRQQIYSLPQLATLVSPLLNSDAKIILFPKSPIIIHHFYCRNCGFIALVSMLSTCTILSLLLVHCGYNSKNEGDIIVVV